jgi:putative cell wall-binding protein
VAGSQDAPVLLVTKTTVPALVAAELTRLKPDVIVIVGGTGAVSATVEKVLGEYAGEVQRVSGADRYDVSARLSAQSLWPAQPVAYVASGEGFADALSGSAAAGQLDGPVLLVHKDSIPGSIALELARLRPSKLVVLGGTNAVSETVVAAHRDVVRDTTRIGGADRYAVSATTSKRAFATGADTVFVASGANFPDALSGSAAAIHAGAPVLLVTATGIPAAVDTELRRLAPTRIVVLGGTRTISPDVMAQLDRFLAP